MDLHVIYSLLFVPTIREEHLNYFYVLQAFRNSEKRVLNYTYVVFRAEKNCKLGPGVNHIFMHSFQPRRGFSLESKIMELNFGCKLHFVATIYNTFSASDCPKPMLKVS